ncbi:MAG: type II secretion system F family protein [Isosphaeraceae bacterium]
MRIEPDRPFDLGREEQISMSGTPGDSNRPRRPKSDVSSVSRSSRDQDPVDPTTFVPNPRVAKKTNRTTDGLKKYDPGPAPAWWERLLFGRVSSGQLASFCRQFAAYLHAGIDISKSLASLQDQYARTALGPVIGRLLLGVKRGDTLAETVAREPQAFDPLFLSMIKVAEARGGIPETLRNLGKHYENRQRLIRQARSALIYPIAVLIVAAFVVALLTIWLLPMFASLLQEAAGRGASLPLPSRVLMAFSSFVQSTGWLFLPAVLIGTPLLLLQLYRTKAGKDFLDPILMIIPVFGLLMRKIDTTRLARTLAVLLDAGVDMGSSLQLTSEVMRLEPFRKAVLDTRTRVIHGDELSDALSRSRKFGPDVIAVIESGEETGKLPETLQHLADDYEEQVEYMVRNMGQLIQPLLMIMLGGLVLFIILAVLLPYIAILTSLSGG